MQDECGVGRLVGWSLVMIRERGSALLRGQQQLRSTLTLLGGGGTQPITQPNQHLPLSRDPNSWGLERKRTLGARWDQSGGG